jgi:hypothetical protein
MGVITDKDTEYFEALFVKVAKWVAIEYGADCVLTINAGNFQRFLDGYHNALALAIENKGFMKKACMVVYNEINGKGIK